MKTRIFLVAVALMVFASLSFGQGFAVEISNVPPTGVVTVQPGPTGGCDGAVYLEGTTVYVYQDLNNDGPDPSDPLADVGELAGQVNFNSFGMINEAYGEPLGYWVMDPVLTSVGAIPPNPYYYLAIPCPTGAGLQWHSATFLLNTPGPQSIYLNANTLLCASCYVPPSCDPTVVATIQVPCGPNDPACRTSVCLDLCNGHETIVRICGPAGLPMDPAHAPFSSWGPGCDAVATECDVVCDPAADFVVTGPFVGADGCWFYSIIGGPQEGCLCFTFESFLAANFNNDFVPLAMDNSVKLTWSTASETNLSRFDIVRGSEVVGRVDATNGSIEHRYEFVDRSAVNGTTYSYTLRSVGMNNDVTDLATVEGVTPSFNAAVITEYALHQNFPNPFNPATEIAFDVLNSNPVTLKIYNAAGQEVATLLNGVSKEQGRYVVNFDAGNLTTGLYFYTVKIGNEFSATKKMLLVK